MNEQTTEKRTEKTQMVEKPVNEKITMEELMTKIGELIAMEIEEVEEVRYADKEMGWTCMVVMKGGREFILSLL